MKPIEMLIIAISFIVVLFLKGLYDKYATRQKILKSLRDGFGKLPKNVYQAERYKYIDYYFKHKAHSGDVIDEITWNDLDMEMVFMTMNHTCTSMGEEYLYAMLHEPEYMKEKLEARGRRIDFFEKNQTARESLGMNLKYIGKMRKMSVFQYIDLLMKAEKHNPLFDIILCIALIVSIVLTIVVSADYIILPLAIAALNIILYYKYNNRIYFSTFGHLTSLVHQIRKVSRMDIPELKSELDVLAKDVKPVYKLGKYSWMFSQGSEIGGTLMDLILDYVKIIFHVDLIMFDFILSALKKHRDVLIEMMEIVGELDADIAIASYRKMKGQYCIPDLFTAQKNAVIVAEDMYHPLIESPVPVSFSTKKSILLTGSNASGKSTFLKTVAINAILAQTIDTVLARDYSGSFFRVYSSMALKDNLMENESYFIVEIKSLKRILEKTNKEVPMLCFIDEVLRGTNTVERIAASSQILGALASMNTLCFAATHDIELTHMLEDVYDNYHFQEKIIDNAVCFDYKLYKGRAVSRNAIKLLGLIGFDELMIEKAEKSGRNFEEKGVWEKYE